MRRGREHAPPPSSGKREKLDGRKCVWGGAKCASASKGEEEGAALGGPGEEREAGLETS